MLLIKNATILTMEGEKDDRFEGSVLIEEGKIKAIGHINEEADEVIDAKGALLIPGMIDAHCHLGLGEDSIGFEGNDINEMTNPVTPEMRAIDGINPMDRNFEEAVEGGVLAVSTGPGSANAIGGTFVVIKTHGKRIDDMIVRDPSALKVAFGENPKRVYNSKNQTPMTRMGTAAKLRSKLYEAKEYYEKKKGDKDHPKYSLGLEAIIPVLEKKIPLKIHAHRADDIFTGIRIAKELDLRYTLDHATEGHLIADFIKEEGASCIVGPSFGARTKFELQNKSFETAKVLNEAGVLVSIMTDHPVIPIQHLHMCGQYAVIAGMDPYEALKALTINPAKILEVDDRLGSLKEGKDADMVLWSGNPLDINSKVELAIMNGEVIYDRNLRTK